MAQVVYTKEVQDYQTGEILEKEIYRRKVANQDQFIRTYIDDIGIIAKCSGAEKGVILCIFKYIDYNTNEFILTSERRGEIRDCGGIKFHTVNSSISRLVKKKIFIKKSSNTFILNSNLFFYGQDISRAKVVKATIVYEIDRSCDC